jgi:hypothetical protein
MKRHIFVLSLLVAFSMVTIAIAQQSSKQQPSKKATVKVVSVDATNNAIKVKDSAGADVTYNVTPTTKFTKEGKTITLADIKADDTLSIEFEESGGNLTAKSVTVMPTKGK